MHKAYFQFHALFSLREDSDLDYLRAILTRRVFSREHIPAYILSTEEIKEGLIYVSLYCPSKINESDLESVKLIVFNCAETIYFTEDTNHLSQRVHQFIITFNTPLKKLSPESLPLLMCPLLNKAVEEYKLDLELYLSNGFLTLVFTSPSKINQEVRLKLRQALDNLYRYPVLLERHIKPD